MLQQQLDFALQSQTPYFHMQYRWESWAIVICVSEHDRKKWPQVVMLYRVSLTLTLSGHRVAIHLSLWEAIWYRMIQDYVLTILTGAAS